MSEKLKYTIYGILFGLCFPLFALILQLTVDSKSFSIENIIQAHQQNVLLYMIDTAPVFLGIFAFFGGISKAKSIDLLDKFKILSEELKNCNEQFNRNSEESFSILLNSTSEIKKLTHQLMISNEEIYQHCRTNKTKAEYLNDSTNTLLFSTSELIQLNKDIKDFNDIINKEVENFTLLIKQLSDNLVKISTVGKEIKILSINSSIEANKYGENGKGFGVISNQVQFLSDKIENLNKETHDIAQSVGNQIDQIHDFVHTQSNKLNHIVQLISRVEDNTSKSKNDLLEINSNLDYSIQIQDIQKNQFSMVNEKITSLSLEKTKIIDNLHQIMEETSGLITKISSL